MTGTSCTHHRLLRIQINLIIQHAEITLIQLLRHDKVQIINTQNESTTNTIKSRISEGKRSSDAIMILR